MLLLPGSIGSRHPWQAAASGLSSSARLAKRYGHLRGCSRGFGSHNHCHHLQKLLHGCAQLIESLRGYVAADVARLQLLLLVGCKRG
jgi:hypothetical protein